MLEISSTELIQRYEKILLYGYYWSFILFFGVKKKLYQLLFLQFLCHILQFIIPCLTELPYQRFFQKFIDRQIFFLSKQNRSFTYVPSVIVYSLERAVIAYSDRIQMTRYRFVEITFAFAIGFSIAQ